MSRTGKRVLVLGLVFVAIQFVGVTRDNPPVEMDIPASPAVHAILQRACYDCHSNQTVWPWYAHVAPVSWMVAHDVHHGREHVNFSTWNKYSTSKQVDIVEEIWKQVSRGDMPPTLYTMPMHSDARLTAEDKAVLQKWSQELAPAGALNR